MNKKASRSDPRQRAARPLAWRLAFAAACVALAIVFREVVLAELGDRLAYVTLYPAVAAAAIFGGAIGGMAAAVFAAVVVHGWLIPLESAADTIGLATFFLSAALISGLAEARQQAWERAARAEAQVQERACENLYRARLAGLFEQTTVGIVQVDPAGQITLINDRGCTMLGDCREALLGSRLGDRLDEDTRPAFEAGIGRLLAGEGGAFDCEGALNQDTSAPIWLRTSLAPVRNADGSVSSVLAMMVDFSELHRQEDALRASHERLQLALDAAEIGTWEVDVASRRATFDGRARAIFGFSDDDTRLSPDDVFALIEPGQMPGIRAAFELAQDPAGDGLYRAEYRIRRCGDGGDRWIGSRGRTLFSHGKAVRLIGVVSDITQRRRADDHLRLLSREVSHRAKNLLAVVQAVARQTAGRDDPAAFADRFSERIAGLAAGQDLLVNNDWRGVDVRELTLAQLAHFRDLVGARIRLAGPPMLLNAQAAQAIGMALHELATNAGKYGALADGNGSVDLGWGIDAGAGPAAFVMSWEEHGGPPAGAEPMRRGFGYVLMVDMVRHALDADVTLEYAPGLVWRLRGPADLAIGEGRHFLGHPIDA